MQSFLCLRLVALSLVSVLGLLAGSAFAGSGVGSGLQGVGGATSDPSDLSLRRHSQIVKKVLKLSQAKQ